MTKFLCARTAFIVAAFFFASVTLPAQTFNTLAAFNGANGGNSMAPLIQGTDGRLYGTTSGGGTYSLGTVFGVTSTGGLTTLHSFCAQAGCPDGSNPDSGLALRSNGNFYGTVFGVGTIIEITPAGKLTTLYTFCSEPLCADGLQPQSTLVQGINGNFYGTTYSGGIGGGTVFEATPSGVLTTLYSFCSQTGCSDGANPMAGLVQGSDGNLYGTTVAGGISASGYGTIFKISPTGKFVSLHSFNVTDGASPQAPLIEGPDGSFYGTAFFGGPQDHGTIFRITAGGKFTTLYNFCSLQRCADGWGPAGGLVLGTDGNFYGTAEFGGMHNYGSIFELTPAGVITTLYSFCSQTSCADGVYPLAGLAQGTDGNFYGTTWRGGSSKKCTGLCGTVFSLSTGLGPFVTSTPDFGKVGWKIDVLGNNLAGTTSVTFNGVPATFSVISDTFIKATVPSGATTGIIQVTTPSRTLSSNVGFHVE